MVMYSVCSPRTVDCPPSLWKNPVTDWNPLIRFATPLAIRPKVIRNIGPKPPTSVVATTTKFLAPSLMSLNFSRIFVPNSTSGVTALRNASPTGARDARNASMAPWNLYIGESSTRLSSRSERIASSSVVACVSCRTRCAWLPSATTFWNRVDIRANWNLPNIVSIA